MAEAVLATGADFLFVCKKDSHKTLYEYVQGAPLEERTVREQRPGRRSLTYNTYRWIEDLPLRDGKDALSVNWLTVRILDAKGKTTYNGAFVTTLPVTADSLFRSIQAYFIAAPSRSTPWLFPGCRAPWSFDESKYRDSSLRSE